MPKASAFSNEPASVSSVKPTTLYLPETDDTCKTSTDDYPPWIGEIHGLSQALLSKSKYERLLWWLVLLVCGGACIVTTTFVVIEYLDGPTATSTTIKLVDSLQFPAITICPKTPDVLNFSAIAGDMRVFFPNMTDDGARDLLQYFLAGNGFENMNNLVKFNRSYLDTLGHMYNTWSEGYSVTDFFYLIQTHYGINCEDLFLSCELSGKTVDCCGQIFIQQVVMRRGLCFQTMATLNQTEADDVGKLSMKLKAPVSTSSLDFARQPQLIAYVNDNYDYALDFPRYYLYPNEFNRMYFTARRIELLEHPGDCTYKIEGIDAACFVRQWIKNTLVHLFGCNVVYLRTVPGTEHYPICNLSTIVGAYYETIQLIEPGAINSSACIPGCHRWEFQTSLQQSTSLEPFEGYQYSLEVSFYNLQYENVKEVYTTSIPSFMSQIGGQFGFFLGLSIITMIQITLHSLKSVLDFFAQDGSFMNALHSYSNNGFLWIKDKYYSLPRISLSLHKDKNKQEGPHDERSHSI
uniref:Acid-sensing ion channel 5 n=1 Tax=Rhabditophanes sp. KR3021 TaxID=114890 RepID=A0AC35TZD6_9BILA